MNLHGFIFGPMDSMELTAFKWWNSKRIEYNVKFLSCLLVAQVLFMLIVIGNVQNSELDFGRNLLGMAVSDLILVAVLNILYYFWPIVELTIFRNLHTLYRKYCFALLNTLNLLIVVGAIGILIMEKV